MRILSGIILSAITVLFALSINGCAGQGQTAAELKRERTRTKIADSQAMRDDLDRVLLTDEPSNLTELSIR